MANATEMLMTHCCHCGHLISRSASGTRSIMRCPKCGAEIEVTVREKTVTVTLARRTSFSARCGPTAMAT